jgi:hypothetical protein
MVDDEGPRVEVTCVPVDGLTTDVAGWLGLSDDLTEPGLLRCVASHLVITPCPDSGCLDWLGTPTVSEVGYRVVAAPPSGFSQRLSPGLYRAACVA